MANLAAEVTYKPNIRSSDLEDRSGRDRRDDPPAIRHPYPTQPVALQAEVADRIPKIATDFLPNTIAG